MIVQQQLTYLSISKDTKPSIILHKIKDFYLPVLVHSDATKEKTLPETG